MNYSSKYLEPILKVSSRIKICGLTRPEDIAIANEILPDYIGLVFAPSPRQVSVERAKALKVLLDPSILSVGVFVNENIDKIVQLCISGILDMVQLHGDEDIKYIERLKEAIPQHPIIKAIHVKSKDDIDRVDLFPCDYFLLDSYKKGSYGGNGTTFDWSLISHISRPYFLAGGIHSGNVIDAVRQCSPFCIDVSSGVETNGIKDPEKMVEIVQLLTHN